MPPQEQKFPPLDKELIDREKTKQEEIVARARAAQKQQQERIQQRKEEKEKLRAIYRSRNTGIPNIQSFDPEKNGKDGKSVAGNQGKED